MCLLSLLFVVVHVILSDKILRSYCLHDKNLTFFLGFINDMQVPKLNADDKEAKGSQCDA